MSITRNPARTLVASMQLILLVVGLLGWEWSARTTPKIQFLLSRPTLIVTRLGVWLESVYTYRDIALTMSETVIGFGIGALAGFALAVGCYYSPFWYQVIRPGLEILNAMPRVVFTPLFLLWFGLGLTSKAAMAASLVLFIVFVGTLSGLQEVDQGLLNRLRVMGANQWDLLRHALIPSGLTWVFSSLRSSVGFALAGAVVSEYLGSSKGLGYRIALAEGNLDSTGIFAGLLILGVVVLGMNTGLLKLEQRLMPWKA